MSSRLSQSDRATLELRSLIMSGSFAANARLSEVALAARLGVSRTPLRQSLDRLVAEGLLERVETGGVRVARFGFEDIVDAIELRGVIEGTAARLAAERGAAPGLLSRADLLLSRLDAAVDRRSGPDFPAYVRLNAEFHDLLTEMPGSPVIARELHRVSRLPLASPSSFLQDQAAIPDFLPSLVRAQGQHRAMIEAIRHREGARAEALAREHARLARQNLEHLRTADRRVAQRVPGLALMTDD